MKRQHMIALVVAIVLGLVAAACGNDDQDPVIQSGERPDDTTTDTDTDDPAGEDDGAFPVTVTADNGEVTIDSRPEAIVVLSPTGTEMLYAIGAGDQVIAVDDYSYFPEGTPVTDLSSYQPNLEAIIGYEPDLVVLSKGVPDVLDGLAALDIPVIHLDSAPDIETTFSQIEVLGAATGHLGDAAELVAQMRTDIDEIVAGLPASLAERTYYHELTPDLYSITSDTYMGEVYSLLGLRSIADEVGGVAESGGFPALNAEFIVDADPDFIFLSDAQCCDQSPETVAARPGWGTMTAVTEDNVIVVDEDVASRWGPRIVEFLRDVAEQVTASVDAG